MASRERPAFKYRGRTEEEVNKHARQSGGMYDNYIRTDVETLKVKAGENEYRILPPTWKDTARWGDSWGIEIWVHNNIGADNGAYLCLDKNKGEDCPICAMRKDLISEGETEDADKLKPSKRILAWVIDRDAEKEGPKVWSLSWTLDKDINARSSDKKTHEVILIDHPEEGYDITFRREGAGLKTKYVAMEIARDPTPICDNEARQDKWLDFIQDNPLPEVLNYYDADYIEKVLSGKVSKKEAKDDDADERPSRRRSRDEDEEEAKPSRMRTSAPEEDEPPKRRRSSEPEEEAPRKRLARDADEEEEKPRRRVTSEDAEDEPETKRPRERARREEPEPEERPRRRLAKDDDIEEDKPVRKRLTRDDEDEQPKRRAREEEDPVAEGRARLKDLKAKAGGKKPTKDEEDEDEIPY